MQNSDWKSLIKIPSPKEKEAHVGFLFFLNNAYLHVL